MLAFIFLVNSIRVTPFIEISFMYSKTTPPAIRGGCFSISNLYSCVTAYGAGSGTFIFFNLAELVIHLYPQDTVQWSDFHS